MQLTRTDAVFSRIAMVSRFCAEIQLSGKFPENITKSIFHPKTHGARRRDGGEPRGAHTHPWRGPGLGRSKGWYGRLSHPLDLAFALYKAPGLKIPGGSTFFQKEFRCSAATRNPNPGPETPFWHPAGTRSWRRSSPSPTPPHQPSMIPPSMCEEFPAVGCRGW